MALPGFAVDMYLSPEEAVTAYIERLIRYPGALQVVDFAEGKVRLVGIKALKGGALVGRPIRELKSHMRNSEARVAAMYREGRKRRARWRHRDPATATRCSSSPRRSDIRAVMKEMQKLEDPVKRVVIAGGGNIGFRLAQTLDDENQVKVIERDSKRARQHLGAAAQLDRAGRRRRRRGTAGRGEHRQRRRVLRADQFRRGQHPLGDAGEAPRGPARHGADQPAGVCRPDAEGLHRRRDLAADGHDRLAARLRAARRRRAGALAAPRLGRGHGNHRARLHGGKVVGRPIEQIKLPDGVKIVTLVAAKK
jgi:hypothetical protein